MKSRLRPKILLLSFFLLAWTPRIGHGLAEENPFTFLPGLEGWVEFWKLVFTRYGASEIIFHDPLDPMKIYKVMEVAEGHKRARHLIQDERKRIAREHGLQDEKRVRAQRGVKERFASGLELSRKYLDQIQRILQEEGVPVELAYLPMVESAFNIHARSRSGALGLWQFMPSTGKQFLRVNRELDERKDPLDSTRAAARLLKSNYELFGNWPLAITAYNHGKEGMLRAIAELGTRDLMEIIQNYQSRTFGFASKSFYAEFLAAVELAGKSDEFFPDLEYHPPLPLEKIKLERSIPIAALLKHTDVSRDQFLEWNPALNPRTKDLPAGYRVKVPADKLEMLLAAYRRADGPASAKRDGHLARPSSIPWIWHRVAPGETLSEIAKAYRISLDELQRANELESVHLISAGQRLKIPKR